MAGVRIVKGESDSERNVTQSHSGTPWSSGRQAGWQTGWWEVEQTGYQALNWIAGDVHQ